jgi:hypothetical protein
VGETTREGGVRDFWPDDSEETFYIGYTSNLSEILYTADKKWPEGFSNLVIGADHIHTTCLGYGKYDPFDHTNFIVVTRVKKE